MYLKTFLLVTLAGAAEINVDEAPSCKHLVDQWNTDSIKEARARNENVATKVGLKFFNHFSEHLPGSNTCMERWCKLTMTYANLLLGWPNLIKKLRGKKNDEESLAITSGNDIKEALSQAEQNLRSNKCPSDEDYQKTRSQLQNIPVNF